MSPRKSRPLTLEYVLLGLLADQPKHGYDLYKQLKSTPSLAMIWRVKRSYLYALLARLEQVGYLSSSVLPGEAHPDRKQLSLTASGKAALDSWMSIPVERPREMRQEFLARLYFTQRLGNHFALILLDEQSQVCQSWLDDVIKQEERLESWQTYEQIVLAYRLHQVKASLSWLESCKAQLQPNPA